MTALSARIAKLEERVSAERKRRGKLKPAYANWDVRPHTIAAAAIVLHGQPKIDEPFDRAWNRTLQHQEIKVNEPLSFNGQCEAALQLWPKIKQDDEEERAWFTKVFSAAPSWLRQFTRICLDAYCLKFDLSETADIPVSWGSDGLAQARQWPRLPCGTMSAGDPIPELDVRQVEIAVSSIALPFSQIEYDPYAEPEPEPPLPPFARLLLLALDLENKPEDEWTRYEKRRMRELERMMGLR